MNTKATAEQGTTAVPKCPTCEKPLEKVKQVDRSMIVWEGKEGKYVQTSNVEAADVVCGGCGENVYDETAGQLPY